MNKVLIREHHDPESEDCGGDYLGLTLFINDIPVVVYGDGYHDNSYDRVEGFLEALELLGYKFKIKYDSKADADCYCSPYMDKIKKSSLKRALKK